MSVILQDLSDPSVRALLKRRNVNPTHQRIAIARVLLRQAIHLTADEVFRLVHAEDRRVSKATVYNTLALLTEKGVIRTVIADPSRVFYDSNTRPHHHFYDENTGKLVDIDASHVEITKLPVLPEGTELQGVDVVIRVRKTREVTEAG